MQEAIGALLMLIGCVIFAVIIYSLLRPRHSQRRSLQRMDDHNDRRPMLAVALLLAVATTCLTGCTRHHLVFVEPGIPVRLGERVPGVSVFVKTRDGDFVKAKADLPAGYWVVTLPEDWDVDARKKAMNLQPEDDE